MKKLFTALLLITLLFCSAGCSSAGGYEALINKTCAAMQKCDLKAVNALFDMDNIEKYVEASYSSGENVSEKINETMSAFKEQEDFIRLCDDLEYEYDKDYQVSHGTIFPDEEQFDLKKLQKQRKLSSDKETLTQTEFINNFVDGLQDVIAAKTTIIIKSKDGENKTRRDVTFYMYKFKGKWYLDYVSYSDISTPRILDTVSSSLLRRDTD